MLKKDAYDNDIAGLKYRDEVYVQKLNKYKESRRAHSERQKEYSLDLKLNRRVPDFLEVSGQFDLVFNKGQNRED